MEWNELFEWSENNECQWNQLTCGAESILQFFFNLIPRNQMKRMKIDGAGIKSYFNSTELRVYKDTTSR